MMETFFIISFIFVVGIFLTRSKVGTAILCIIIAFVIIGVIKESHQEQIEKEEHEGKVQMYHDGHFEWVTLEEYGAIIKKEGEDHYHKWAVEHPEEAEKERIKDSAFRAHYGMRDFGYKTWRLQLLKELDDAYVYKIMDAVSEEDDYDDGEENEDYDDDGDETEVETFGCQECEAIVADSKGNIYFTNVLTYDGNHYTKDEISRWRYNFFEALLDISKREQYMTKEECLEEIVGMTDYRVASLMPYNTPEGYADIVAL